MRNATFRQLRVFVEVARHLSFARAAEALHLTPPAVTMQIKELEGHVGLPLFERQGRRVTLTTAGEYMLVYARKVLATLKDAEDTAARLKRLEVGQLTIGMVGSAQYFLPALLTAFQQEHRGVDLRLATGNREHLLRLLQANELDVAIMGRPPTGLAVRAEPFAAHPHVFIAPLHHPLLRVGHPRLEALAPYPFIARERGSGTRALLEQFAQRQGVELRIAMELPDNEAIKQAVMAGLGLGFVSLHALKWELQHGLIARLDVEGTPLVRAWHVVHTLSKLLSPAAEAFRYFVLERGEAFLAERYGALLPLAPAG